MRIKHRRNVVRAVSYCAAAFIIAVGMAVSANVRADKMKLNIENTYQRSLNELAVHLENINLNLQKARYAGTTSQMIGLSSEIKSEAREASDALSQVSLSSVNLESTSKFISQTGDYANTIAKKVSEKTELSDSDRKNLEALYTNCSHLSDELNEVLAEVHQGKLSLYKAEEAQNDFADEKTQQVSALASGFQDIEDNVSGLPSLIYDGPFSDNTLKKNPEITKNLKDVSRDTAKTAAAKFLNTDKSKLSDDGDSSGNLPTYNFKTGTISIDVSKKGGLVVRMIDSKIPASSKFDGGKAEEIITKFLDAQGIKDMRSTYFLINKNVCTVNFAYMQGDITCYTDLIKVGVSLDDGKIASYDATGYIMNHKKRTLPKASYKQSEAQKELSPLLTVNKTSLALIPVNGTGEALCYEFKCTDKKENRSVIDYYNVTNGNEERILILLETPGGTLTM